MIYQLLIELKNVKPKIWRRILISPETTLKDLNLIIQTTMGWTNSHLHQFFINKEFYCPKLEENFFMEDFGNHFYTDDKIKDFVVNEKLNMVYEYDFGDGWEHKIKLEKILDKEPNKYYPVCIKGKNTCPPEDCGGPWGFMNMLDILKDKKHPEYKEYIDWLGGGFEIDDFDLVIVNEGLNEENFGCYNSMLF